MTMSGNELMWRALECGILASALQYARQEKPDLVPWLSTQLAESLDTLKEAENAS